MATFGATELLIGNWGRKAPQEQSIKINFNIAQPCQYLLSNYINKLVNEINQMTAD